MNNEKSKYILSWFWHKTCYIYGEYIYLLKSININPLDI